MARIATRSGTFVALLRGINVSGHHRIPMAELRSVCADIGCSDVGTYIQSGNVVFRSAESAEQLEEGLEQAIQRQFGFFVPVIVRPASSWIRYLESNPFPDEASQAGNHVLLALSKLPPETGAASELQRRATLGEQVAAANDAIWIHYANGIARSKLTPAVLDRCVGSPVTGRNWRTVLKLDEMTRESETG